MNLDGQLSCHPETQMVSLLLSRGQKVDKFMFLLSLGPGRRSVIHRESSCPRARNLDDARRERQGEGIAVSPYQSCGKYAVR